MRKLKKLEWIILIFNVIYILVFAFLFAGRKNYEFLIYVGVVSFFVVFVAIQHLKYNFSYGTLIGLSLWGLMHMFGGGIILNDRNVLYTYQIFPFLRFDQFVHAFGFGFATLFSYYILKPSLNKNYNKFAVSVLLVLIGMGLGALNEIIEFTTVLAVPKTGVGGYENTLWDLVFNTIGAVIAIAYLRISKKL